MSSSRYAQASRAGGGATGNNVIGANEDMFRQAFDSTPKLNIATQKKMENELQGVMAIISNPHAEWNNRVKAIQHFRTLVNSGIADTDDFHTTTLKTLEIPFQNNICDLRSQVVRETCITIAFLSCRLQQKFSRMAEILLPSLIKLIPNSAKIMSTSALVALRFIIQSTHNSRLITIIKYQLSTSKSKDIHRALCEIAERIVTLWPPHVIERHLNDLQEVLRLGICNSDEAARQSSRRAFNVFAENFREPADKLFNSLDQQRQRMLNNLNHGGGSTLTMNGYGSTASNLNTAGLTASSSTAQSSSNYGPSSIASPANLVSRLKGPLASTTTTTNGTSSGIATASPSRIRTPTARSTSAIDVNAQRRARARAVYLSSMYTRPRQIGTLNSPAKSTIPTSTTINQHNHASNPSTPAQSAATPTNHYQHHHPISTVQQQSQQKQQHITAPQPHYQYTQSLNNSSLSSNSNNNSNNNNNIDNLSSYSNQSTPPASSAHQQLQQLQQQQAASAEKKDGVALSKAAAYLLSVVNNNTIAENQVVTTMKYLNSLIEKHPAEIVSQYLPELMPPLVVGIDNAAISVRKASVFAMVSINSKVGLKEMESYLTSLTMTQKKLLEVYIRKFKEENKGKAVGGGGGDNQETTSRRLSSSVVDHSLSSSTSLQQQQQQPQPQQEQQQQQQITSPDIL